MELATDGTRNSLGRVDVSVEGGGVLLDLLELEAEATVVGAVRLDTGLEGALEAALAGADGTALGVGERDSGGNMSVHSEMICLVSMQCLPGRTRHALVGLVDVGGSVGR